MTIDACLVFIAFNGREYGAEYLNVAIGDWLIPVPNVEQDCGWALARRLYPDGGTLHLSDELEGWVPTSMLDWPSPVEVVCP